MKTEVEGVDTGGQIDMGCWYCAAVLVAEQERDNSDQSYRIVNRSTGRLEVDTVSISAV